MATFFANFINLIIMCLAFAVVMLIAKKFSKRRKNRYLLILRLFVLSHLITKCDQVAKC
jgi:uncharacterized membrane protein YfhO